MITEILDCTSEKNFPSSLEKAISLLQKNQVVALPTETVYGLASRAENEKALQKIFEAKKRPFHDPLIGHLPDDLASLESLIDSGWVASSAQENSLNQEIWTSLMKAFWPGPLTLLLPRGPRVPDMMTAGSPWVALRRPLHFVFTEILNQLKEPLAAPSANLFGQTSPVSAQHVYNQLQGRIPLILNGGTCSVGLESTIVQLSSISPSQGTQHGSSELKILRPGGVSKEALEKALQPFLSEMKLSWLTHHNANSENFLNQTSSQKGLPAPGLLDQHYAPQAPLKRFDHLSDLDEALSSSLVFCIYILTQEASKENLAQKLSQATNSPRPHRIYDLSSSDSFAAQNLYSVLHESDQILSQFKGKKCIYIEFPKQSHGLWPAVADRIRRASQPLISGS